MHSAWKIIYIEEILCGQHWLTNKLPGLLRTGWLMHGLQKGWGSSKKCLGLDSLVWYKYKLPIPLSLIPALIHSGLALSYGVIIYCCWVSNVVIRLETIVSLESRTSLYSVKKIQLPIPSHTIWCESMRHFHWLFVHWWWRHYDKDLIQPIEKIPNSLCWVVCCS